MVPLHITGTNRSWQKKEDMPHRRRILSLLFRMLSTKAERRYASGFDDLSLDAVEQYKRDVVRPSKQLEAVLYKRARSLEHYGDTSTLKERLIEVALEAGLSRSRSLRGQRPLLRT